MMKKNEFDCVKMKRTIQKKMYKEMKGMDDKALGKYLQSGYEDGAFADKVNRNRESLSKPRRKTG